jgi:hypothetical protein
MHSRRYLPTAETTTMPDARQSQQRALAKADAWASSAGERHMLIGLLTWLTATGRLRHATHVALEVPWRGRRIDAATINSKSVSCAFELKRDASQRAFEQAVYNQLSFDRSFVVVPTCPTSTTLDLADELSIGVLQINGTARLWRAPGPPSTHAFDRVAVREAIHRTACR